MTRSSLLLAFALLLFTACNQAPIHAGHAGHAGQNQTAPAASQAPADASAQVKSQLDAFVADYLQGYNLALRPGKTTPEVTRRDGKHVSLYFEMDPASARAEIYTPSEGSAFLYMARLTYLEHSYEAVGESPAEARNGVYMRIKSRRLTELLRYVDGAWHN